MPSKCPFCNQVDSRNHYFYACNFATQVWHSFSHLFPASFIFPTSLFGIMSYCLDKSAPEFIQLLAVFVPWSLWRMRNAIFFDGKSASLPWVLRLVVDFFHGATFSSPLRLHPDFILQLQGVPYIHHMIQRRRTMVVSWNPPPFNSFKLNVDGSSCGNPGPSGCGLVLRDYSGQLITAKAIFVGMGTSLFAELQAMLLGMLECQQMGLTQVCIESDSKLVVDMLATRSSWPWQYHHTLRRLFTLRQQLNFSITHIYREANSVADGLSKLASSTCSDFSYTFMTLPQYLKGLVALDRISYPYIRRCAGPPIM